MSVCPFWILWNFKTDGASVSIYLYVLTFYDVNIFILLRKSSIVSVCPFVRFKKSFPLWKKNIILRLPKAFGGPSNETKTDNGQRTPR